MPDYLRDWYYLEPDRRGNTSVRGPCTVDQMRDLIKDGALTGETRVKCGPDSHWHPLRDVHTVFHMPSPKAKPSSGRSGPTKNQKLLVFGVAMIIAIAAVIQLSRAPEDLVERRTFHQETLGGNAVIGITNNTRIQHGLPALKDNELLDAVAESRAKDMLEKQYFAHVSPAGEQASDIAQRVGYRYKIIAENIASGPFLTNQKIVDGWMQSPGHRRNILSPDVQEIGVSIVKGRLDGAETWVSVQVFGLPSLPVSKRVCVPPSQDLLRDIEKKRAEIAAITERVNRLKQELEAENDVIESDRQVVGNDTRKIQDLDLKIRQYNEKCAWHNQSLLEIRAKESILDSMIREYNTAVQSYKECATAA